MAIPVGSFHYSFSEKFDYRQYMETKSHFADLAVSIDESINRVGGTLYEIDERRSEIDFSPIIDGMGQISDSINELSEQIDGRLGDIENLLEWGFRELIDGQQEIISILSNIEGMLRRPEYTWSYEQFEISREAFGRDEPLLAMEFIEYAINGRGDHTGYPLEYRFYFLRGQLKLGSCRSFVADHVDAKGAYDDLIRAANLFNENEKKVYKGLIYSFAGRAAYYFGDMAESTRCLRLALDLGFRNGITYFYLSKANLAYGDKKSALENLEHAVRADILLVSRTAMEADFVAIKSDVVELFEKLRLEYRNNVIRMHNNLVNNGVKEMGSLFGSAGALRV